MNKKQFGRRLAQLRKAKSISAREMSIKIGQSESYINNVENSVNYPKMATFFCICDYLDVTPKEFFDVDLKDPQKANELYNIIRQLNNKDLEHLTAIAKSLID